jgi:5-methylthioadenosine/S-adenosylhomocysteine deaminase
MVQERFGTTPVRHLARHGLLDARLTAAHAVCVDLEEIGLLARAGCGVVHCAESNLKLASGIAPVEKLLQAAIAVGLGTDGAASNNDLDLVGEMGTVAKLHKIAPPDPTALPARRVLRMATAGGAAALHREREFGSLEAGKRADLILVDASGPNAVPLYDPASYLVYAARADAVRTVVVEGRVLMEKRRIRTLDARAIRREAGRYGRRIAAALPESAA